MITVYGTTFAQVRDHARHACTTACWLQVVVDIEPIEDNAIRLWLSDGNTINLGPQGLLQVARLRVLTSRNLKSQSRRDRSVPLLY
jgi:hypothetical protein